MKFKLVLFISLLIVHTAFSQESNLTISGKVKDDKGHAIEGAVVTLSGTSQVVHTDAHGKFSFENLQANEYRLNITSIGYKSQSKTASLLPGKSVFIHVALEEEIATEKVVVKEKLQSTIIKESGFTVLSIDLNEYKNSTADVSHVLNSSSGVRIRQSGGVGSDYNFSLNGLSDYRVRFFVDGIPIDYLGDAYKLNNLPVNLVDRVDVYKGVVPVYLGADALGGAVNIISTPSRRSYLDASYSYGSFNTHRVALNSQYRNQKSGFTLRPKAFYNFSNNNYIMRDMEVYVNRKWETLDVRRFHDNYLSATATLEAGFTHVKWADELMFAYSLSGTKDDTQTDFYGNPRGEVRSEELSHIASLRYSKSGLLKEKLDLNLFSVYNTRDYLSIDTSSNRYNWLGEITRVANDNSAELFNEKTLFEYTQKTFISRANVNYHLTKTQTICANYLGFHIRRQGENRLGVPEEEPFRSPNTLNKDVFGLSYDVNLFKDKLNVNVAAKYYHFRLFTRQAKVLSDYSIVINDLRTNQYKPGYHIAARYFITSGFYVKSSFEKGYRLPEPVEIFGDGLGIYANPALQPESSNNFNFGMNLNQPLGKDRLTSEINFFMRDVSNYTFRRAYIRGSRFENILSVLIYGYEAEVKYKLNKRFVANANFTRQYVLNNEKYVKGTTRANRVYRDHLPNTPYLFWNAGLRYELPQKDKPFSLSVHYSFNYVHKFYLAYSSVARGGGKNMIPTQALHNIGATISSKDNKYSFTLEAQNILNALAFDNFNIQRPGRAFYAKLRYYLK